MKHDEEAEVLRRVTGEVLRAIKGKGTVEAGVYVGALFHAAIMICIAYGVTREEVVARIGEHYDAVRRQGTN
jgi:hypothetical protein